MWIVKRIITGLDFKLSVALTAVMFFIIEGSVSLGFVSPILFWVYTIFAMYALGKLGDYAYQVVAMCEIAEDNGADIREPSEKAVTLMEITAKILVIGYLFTVLLIIFNPVPKWLLLTFIFFSTYGISSMILAGRFTDHFVEIFNENVEVRHENT